MKVTHFGTAPEYEAPNHFHVRSLRMQGFEPDGPKNFWLGLSQIAPGGGAGPDSSALEKVYYVVQGHVTVRTPTGEAKLGPGSSCYIAPNEVREMLNREEATAVMVVVMPYPEKQS